MCFTCFICFMFYVLRDFAMNRIILFMKNEVKKKDYNLVEKYEDYEIERIKGLKQPFKEWLDSYVASSDETFLVVSRPYILGASLDEFLTNGLQCIEKRLKVVFKCRFNLSFHQMINYSVFTTIEQQKAAFCSLYGVVMTDLYSHKNGRKRDPKIVKQLRNYWLAYIYKYARPFKGALSVVDIAKNLHISTVTYHELKYEIKGMLANGEEQELESLVMNELYKESSKETESKQLEKFKEKLTQALSSSNTQLDLFTDEQIESIV